MSIDYESTLGFYPSYCDHGLVSKVLYHFETVAVNLTIGTVVKQACRQYALDRRALANAARFVSGRPNLVPMPLCLNRTFAPLKVHAPVVDGDPAYGYFLIQGITKVDARDGGSVLMLVNGACVELVQNRNAVLAHVARALLFERAFWSKRLGTSYWLDRQDFARSVGK